MSKLILEELYIFELSSKKAKKIEFVEGINVITSNQENGNDVGKSIVMKSIYHTLGADCFFDDKWSEEPKVYYLKMKINGESYSIYRNQKLFKIYKNDEIYLTTVNRNELSKVLSQIYNFKVLLPNRAEK